jgi:predicted metalloprotease
MTFRPGARLDPSQVRDVGGRGVRGLSGRSLAVGGGGIGSIVLLAVLVLASGILGGGESGSGLGSLVGQSLGDQGGSDLAAECRTGEDANRRDDCRVVGFVDSIQAYWNDEFARSGSRYVLAMTILYQGAVETGCGVADSGVGPFYCPPDQDVYLDVSFFQDLTDRFGAEGGPLAQGYVIAHEYGHHVQNLTGQLASGGSTGAGSDAVMTELQADCYAGVWAANAVDTGYLEPLTQTEVAQALDAAAAVGDDRIQQRTTGTIDPEAWTHGSAAQRQGAFEAGYRGAEPDSCSGT